MIKLSRAHEDALHILDESEVLTDLAARTAIGRSHTQTLTGLEVRGYARYYVKERAWTITAEGRRWLAHRMWGGLKVAV